LLVAGLAIKIEWLRYAEPELWQQRLLEQMNEEDPVLLFQNPALDLLQLEKLIGFHGEQQADCSLRLSPSRGANGIPVYLDEACQVQTLGKGPACYDTRCYLIEPDIFEALLDQPVNLLRQPLLPVLLEAAEFVSGLCSEGLWAEWLKPQDYFNSQKLILQQRLLEPAHRRRLQHKDATVWLGEDVLIAPDVSFSGPVVLGDQVSLAAGVKIQGPAVIGARTQVLAQSQIEQSWIWPGCELGRRSQIRHSWLGEQVKVGQNSQLTRLWAADHSQLKLSQPLPEGSILGPYSQLDNSS
ncbi:MAG TPA: NDP-sugar synthase, partial [Candidatus Obscuribacterales bacterium]